MQCKVRWQWNEVWSQLVFTSYVISLVLGIRAIDKMCSKLRIHSSSTINTINSLHLWYNFSLTIIFDYLLDTRPFIPSLDLASILNL